MRRLAGRDRRFALSLGTPRSNCQRTALVQVRSISVVGHLRSQRSLRQARRHRILAGEVGAAT